MIQKYFAHSVEGRPTDEWQPLDEHLLNVAELARTFANEFGSIQFSYLAGFLHYLWLFVTFVFSIIFYFLSFDIYSTCSIPLPIDPKNNSHQLMFVFYYLFYFFSHFILSSSLLL